MSSDIKKGEPKFFNGPSSKLLAIPMNLTCSIPNLGTLHIIRQYTKIKISYHDPPSLPRPKAQFWKAGIKLYQRRNGILQMPKNIPITRRPQNLQKDKI
jgi:hypothetical protein